MKTHSFYFNKKEFKVEEIEENIIEVNFMIGRFDITCHIANQGEKKSIEFSYNLTKPTQIEKVFAKFSKLNPLEYIFHYYKSLGFSDQAWFLLQELFDASIANPDYVFELPILGLANNDNYSHNDQRIYIKNGEVVLRWVAWVDVDKIDLDTKNSYNGITIINIEEIYYFVEFIQNLILNDLNPFLMQNNYDDVSQIT
ncbi:MAG: hypothetical protein ACRC80_08445, partial [Waterburya sp.]